ncbi:MAG: DUF2442 domain-containing protein [Methylocystis sp.]
MPSEQENARPVEAHCDEAFLNVTLADGRVIRAPLWWYPQLLKAEPRARSLSELSPLGVHWPEIDEDISAASMLQGWKAPGARKPA